MDIFFKLLAANLVSKAITAPTNQQIEAERQREFLIEKERMLREKSNAMVSDLINGKNYSPEQILQIHAMADAELNKILIADRQSLTYVSPASNNAANAIGRFAGGWILGVLLFIILISLLK
jgi:hypothetical protein